MKDTKYLLCNQTGCFFSCGTFGEMVVHLKDFHKIKSWDEWLERRASQKGDSEHE